MSTEDRLDTLYTTGQTFGWLYEFPVALWNMVVANILLKIKTIVIEIQYYQTNECAV